MVASVMTELVEISLERVESWDFESFGMQFCAAIEGTEFVPLGGMHDGGAEGFLDGVKESQRPGVFYQFSVTSNHKDKVRKTIKRLKEFGRVPKTIVYVTSKIIQHIDNEEFDLTDELGVIVKIRDGKYISTHINNSPSSIAAFNEKLKHYTNFLKQIGASNVIPKSVNVSDPSVYVFLQQEVDNRLGNKNLLITVTDTLILWALNDTDPDRGIFLKRSEILSKIIEAIPWSKQFIRAHIDQRLLALSQKKNSEGRQISWWRKEDKFCLPYETRQIIYDENLVDEALKITVVQEFENLLVERKLCSDDDLNIISGLIISVIQKFFETEGLSFSYFLKDEGKTTVVNTIEDRIEDILNNESVTASNIDIYREAIRSIIQSVFYDSSDNQREYLYHLSRTYVLLFTLQAEPRIIEYFQGMTSSFRLYVGSDIIVRALSERYLDSSDTNVNNMLKIASEVGVELYITEPVIEEVLTHIKGTNYEFKNYFLEIEPHVNRFVASQSNKILIRAYFYAKELGKVSGWRSFIGQFLTYSKLETQEAKNELMQFLVSKYNLKYISKAELKEFVNEADVKQLANKLAEDKSKEELAYNDALMVHGVYGMRRKNHESSSVTDYGYSTWWLTQETKVQRHTVDLVRANFSRYIMRPEFLLNYFALAPRKAEITKTFRSIFPSTIGLQMGHRMNEDLYHSVLNKVKDWADHDPSRVKVMVGDMSNKLKSDSMRIYSQGFTNLDDCWKSE